MEAAWRASRSGGQADCRPDPPVSPFSVKEARAGPADGTVVTALAPAEPDPPDHFSRAVLAVSGRAHASACREGILRGSCLVKIGSPCPRLSGRPAGNALAALAGNQAAGGIRIGSVPPAARRLVRPSPWRGLPVARDTAPDAVARLTSRNQAAAAEPLPIRPAGRFSGSPRALAQGSTRLLELQSGTAVGSRQRCPGISGFEFRWEHQSCVGPGAWAAASRRISSPSRRMRRRIPFWRCPVPARGGWRSGGLRQPARKGWIPAPARFRRRQAAIVASGSGQSVLAGAGRLAQAAAPPGSARVEDVWTRARRCPGGRSRREEAARLAGAPVPAVAPSRCRTAHRPF